MDNAKSKIAALVVKGIVGLTVTAGIGYAIKAERLAKEKIDDYFAPETELETEIQEITES